MYAPPFAANPVVLVVDERDNRKPDRHHDIRRRRHQPRDESHQVREQDEKKQRRQEAGEALEAVPDDLLTLLGRKLVRHLRKVLHRTGPLHLERHPHHNEVGEQDEEHQQLHRERVADRRLRKLGMHVNRIQQRRGGRGEVHVQKSGQK